jgi:hypothetical protein
MNISSTLGSCIQQEYPANACSVLNVYALNIGIKLSVGCEEVSEPNHWLKEKTFLLFNIK